MARTVAFALMLAAATPTVTAREIAQLYDENELAADAAYKGKSVSVTGKVAKVWRSPTKGEGVVVELSTGLEQTYLDVINCELRADQPDAAIAKLRRGKKATLACVGAGRNSRVLMKDCELSGLR